MIRKLLPRVQAVLLVYECGTRAPRLVIRAHSDYTAVTSPPFGLSVAPTKYDDSSLARNATVAATSSGRPRRPSGVRSFVAAPSLPLSAREVETWMNPGATAFTRTPWTASSFATARVRPRMPAFAAE